MLGVYVLPLHYRAARQPRQDSNLDLIIISDNQTSTVLLIVCDLKGRTKLRWVDMGQSYGLKW
jgi:hypothetical protein